MSVECYYLQRLLLFESEERSSIYLQHKQRGLSEEWFHNDKERMVLLFVEDYYTRYNRLPTIEIVEAENEYVFPSYEPKEPLLFWFDELQRSHVTYAVTQGMQQLQVLIEDGDTIQISENLLRLSQNIAAVMRSNSTQNILELAEAGLLEHDVRQKNASVRGVMFDIEYIDRMTGGAVGGDVWSIIGRISTGKSYTLFRLAEAAFRLGKRVLLVNMEMQNQAVGNRIVSMGAGISNTMYRHGMLPYYTRANVEEYIKNLVTSGRAEEFIFVEGRLNMSTADLLVQIRLHKPDVVFVDGAYLLRNSYGRGLPTVERIKVVAEELRQIALQEDIPLIPSYQFARGGDKKGLEGIGWSDAVGQVSTIVFGLTNEDDETVATGKLVVYKILELLKGREGETGKLRLRYDLLHSKITQDCVLEGNTIMQWFYNEGRDSEPRFDND